MLPGILAGVAESSKTGTGVAGPLARSGTAREDEEQTASGGSGTYSWVRNSDSAVVGTGSSYTYTTSDVGEQIDLQDGASIVVGTEVGSSALGWFSAADYAAGEIPNRGLMTYPVLDDSLGGPATGTDDLGPYCDFTGVDGLQTATAELCPYAGSDFTVYCLSDTLDGAASTFAGEMYQTGERISIRHVAGGDLNLLVTANSYQTYGAWTPDASELSCFVLDSAAGTGARYGYHDAEVITGVASDPAGFGGTVDFSFGGLYTGVQAPDGKLRFLAFYPGNHDATKRAEVRAALKRVWAHVDAAPTEFATLVGDYDAANVTRDGSDNVTVMDDSFGSNDIAHSGTTEGVYNDGDANFGGAAYVRVQPADDTEYGTAVATFDWGTDYTDSTFVIVNEYVTGTNGGYLIANYAVGGGFYPQIRETPSAVIYYAHNGSDGVSITRADGDVLALVATSEGGTSKLYSGGKLTDSTVSAATTKDQLSRMRLLGNGAAGGDFRTARILLFRGSFTATEALVTGCWANSEYGVDLAA